MNSNEVISGNDLGERPVPPGPPGLLRVGTVVEQVRPIARVLLDDRDPTDVGIKDLRGHTRPTHPGDPAEVYYVYSCAGETEIEFVWKRAIESDCLERLAIERGVYKQIDGRTRRVPTIYAEMADSDSGGGIAIEYLPRMALEVYDKGIPSKREVGKVAQALAEFARDVPVTAKVGSYSAQVIARIQKLSRRSAIWKYVVEFFYGEAGRLDELEIVMSPGFSPPNIGFRADDPLPVFFDLDTVIARPIGSGLITGLAFHDEFDELVPIIAQSIPQLTVQDICLVALGRVIEQWGEGDPRGRPRACRCLDMLGVPISEEIRSS